MSNQDPPKARGPLKNDRQVLHDTCLRAIDQRALFMGVASVVYLLP